MSEAPVSPAGRKSAPAGATLDYVRKVIAFAGAENL